jgi:hypothetical protein
MTRHTSAQVYDMDPAHRPDREIIAKEIDKLDGGRPVTHFDVLAWMQVLYLHACSHAGGDLVVREHKLVVRRHKQAVPTAHALTQAVLTPPYPRTAPAPPRAAAQTRKRMIKKKEERQAMLKEPMRQQSIHGLSQNPVPVTPSWHVQVAALLPSRRGSAW